MSELSGCLSIKDDAEICKKCARATSDAPASKFKIVQAKVHDYECDGYVNKKTPPIIFR